MSGVGITGKIEPLNGGAFPVYEDINGQGGLRTVADITARNAVSANILFCKEGMQVYVQSNKCYYELASDLATWNFVDASLELASQTAWFVSTTGNDNNDGKTSVTALATTEELSKRLCPFGRKCVVTSATGVVVTLGAGTFTELDISIDWPASLGFQAAAFVVQGNVSSSASIALSGVVNTAAPGTRGQLTTLAGSFTAQKRIRSTSGANIGAICFSTGQNAGPQNHFVSHWVNYNTSSVINVANGTTCVVDTLNTTLKMCKTTSSGNGYIQIQDLAIIDVRNRVEDAYPNGSFFFGCELAGGGNGIWENLGAAGGNLFCCRNISATFLSSGADTWYLEGFAVQATLTLYGRGSECRAAYGVVIDGATGGNIDIARGILRPQTGDVEFCNGGSGTAILVEAGSALNSVTGSLLWGQSTPFAIGINVSQDASLNLFRASDVSFPATVNYQLGNETFSYGDAPIALPEIAACVSVSADVTALSTSGATVSLSAAARGNIGTTNVFAANPRKGLYRFQAYVAATVAGTLGALNINAIFTDDSGVTRTVIVATLAAITGTGGAGGEIIIETNGSTQVQYSVTGVTTQGSLQYSMRINCRIESPG